MAKAQDAGVWARFLHWVVGGALDRMDEVRENVQRGTKVIVGCPECGTRYSVREKDAGRGVKCPKCNVILPLGSGGEGGREQPPPAPKPSPAAPAISASLTETLVSRAPALDGEPLPHYLSLTLTVLEGADRGSRLTLSRTRTVLGRRDAHFLLNDPEISSLHAAITVDGYRCSLRDLQSTNGTFLNGKRIEEAPLAHQDEVRLGRTTLLFTVTPNTPNTPDTP